MSALLPVACSSDDTQPGGGELADLLADLPSPVEVDGDASISCVRFGYTCPADATPEQRDVAHAALDRVTGVMADIEDPYDQLSAALTELGRMDGIGNVQADIEGGSLVEFTVDDGPAVGLVTSAGAVQELSGEVPEVDVAYQPEAGEPASDSSNDESESEEEGPVGIRSGPLTTPATPDGYEPAGGPLQPRSALIVNPFEWDVADIVSIFRAEDEYGTVDVLSGSDVNPIRLMAMADYDAVYVFSHGGGSANGSTVMGGVIDVAEFEAEATTLDVNPAFDWYECQSVTPWIDINYGPVRYCFRSVSFPMNPDGIAFFNVCGSEGFESAGAGATVTWSATADTRVSKRTAAAFWDLMVTDGVDFELARDLVKGRRLDDHGDLFLTTAPRETVAVFAGRNLRARDVIEARIDGAEMAGQVVHLDGSIADGSPETFPAQGQELTFEIDGVRLGTEAGVQFEVRGDDEEWTADINLLRDGTVIDEKDGYGTWRVTLRAGAVEVPDRTFSHLTDDLTELEVRAFEKQGEYTADAGEVRLGMDVVAHGPFPHLQQLESEAAASGGSVEGNDLAVAFNTGGGDVTGELHMTMSASGVRLIRWDLSLAGTYDPATASMSGTGTGSSQSYSMGAVDSGIGRFTGQVNPADGTVSLAFDGTPFTYTGTISG